MRTLLPVLCVLAACGTTDDVEEEFFELEDVTQEVSDLDAAARTIGEPQLAGAIRFLAHDLLEGRGVATRGDELARLYIQTEFETYGLEPGGVDGTWEQPVPIIGITSEVTKPFTVRSASGSITFEAPGDYTAEASRPTEVTAWGDAPIVFVGYGIHAPEQDWDDFKDTDLTGKVALVMNNDPDWDPDLFEGNTRLYYGRWSYKFEEAARRGAIGAIVIHTTPSAGYPFQVIQAGHGREQFWLPFDDSTPRLQLRTWCSDEAAKKICALGGKDLDELRASAKRRDFRPVVLGVSGELATANQVRELRSANVAGVLRGSDPALRDEVVVISAHFDHLGIGRPKRGDEIYNGALDNASGSAAMLNIARACAHLPNAPRRTLLFLAVTAEESGLLGSKYYARHPTFPRERIVGNFNIDGINIWGATTDISMIGYGKNSLTALAERVAARHGRELVPNPQVELGLFYRSDHFSFARIGVPAAYFKAGRDFLENVEGKRRVKQSYTAVRYHQPNDQFDDRWDLSGAVADTRLIFECLVEAANADAAPSWTPGDEFEKLR
ncbi:MAG: M28 family peptidase [Planctomycetes bacterium]|nr:M28 family peptidase [Planctomycetota bacterium]